MAEKINKVEYIDILEKAKEQYKQYLEVSKLYELPVGNQKTTEVQYKPPSPEHPLTTNHISIL